MPFGSTSCSEGDSPLDPSHRAPTIVSWNENVSNRAVVRRQRDADAVSTLGVGEVLTYQVVLVAVTHWLQISG